MGSRILNGLICLVCTVLGVTLAFATNQDFQETIRELVDADPRVVLGVLLGGIGYLIGATFSFEFDRWLEDVLPRVRVRDVVWGAAGALGGMVLANLAILPMIVVLNLGHVSDTLAATAFGRLVLPVGLILVPTSLNLFLAYLGATFMLRKQNELGFLAMGPSDEDLMRLPKRTRYLLDTSAVIDGRVHELVKLGLLDGPLVAPRFVLEELQLLGDSSDESKRKRGQRGLEILEAIKLQEGVTLLIPEVDFEGAAQVDEKLLRYARSEPHVLVTNDYNLSKLAALEGIESLSLHSLADVMRPVALPGEVLDVEVVKAGKEKGQGVGYLADGSMVVVRETADRLGERLQVTIERVLQTSAGRMLFAHPAEADVPAEEPPRLQSLPPAQET